MLRFLLIILLVASEPGFLVAQETTIFDVFGFVPGVPPTKRELIADQYDHDAVYDHDFLYGLPQTWRKLKQDQINYSWSSKRIHAIATSENNFLIKIQTNEKQDTAILVVWDHWYGDTLTYRFSYNAMGKIQKYHVNYKECWTRLSSDVGDVIYSDVAFTYTSSGMPLQINYSCITGQESFLVNYFYNSQGDLDSIVNSSEIMNHRSIRKKIICSNENLFTDSIDFKSSIKISYYEQNKVSYSYLYEFDSLERITSFFKLDSKNESHTYAEYYDLEDNSEAEAFLFYYGEKGPLLGIDYSHQGRSRLSQWSDANRLIIKRDDKTDKIIALQFYNGSMPVGQYSKKKGWEDFNPFLPLKEKKETKLFEQLSKKQAVVDSLLENFPNDTILLYSRYRDNFSNPDTTCKFLVKHSFNRWILSDTVNNIVRYLLIEPDDHLTTFYYKSGKLFRMRLWDSSGNGINIYPRKHSFIAVVNEVVPNSPFKKTDFPELKIFGSRNKRCVYPKHWKRFYLEGGENMYIKYAMSIFQSKRDFYKYLDKRCKDLFDLI